MGLSQLQTDLSCPVLEAITAMLVGELHIRSKIVSLMLEAVVLSQLNIEIQACGSLSVAVR